MDGEPASGFCFACHGPLFRLERALGLRRGRSSDLARRCAAIVLLTWVPFMLLAAIGGLWRGQWEPLLFQIETHVRSLVSVPLIIVAEQLLDKRAAEILGYLLTSGIVGPGQQEGLARARSGIEGALERPIVEIALAVAAVLSTALQLGADSGLAQWWYGLVAMAAYRFVLLRWLLFWLLWTVLLSRIAGLDLGLRGTHPDRAGGLSLLAHSCHAFAVAAMAAGSVLSATWGTRIVAGAATLTAFQRLFAAYAALVIAIGLLPFLAFVPVLGRCRLAALRAYGAFAAHYVDDFHRKWIGSPAEDPLGSPDIQSLADLQGSFQVVQEMRLVVWDRRILLTLGLAALMPMLPLVLAAAPVGPLLRRVIRMLL